MTFWGTDILDKDAVSPPPLTPPAWGQMDSKCWQDSASVNSDYPPIQLHIHGHAVNTNSIIVFSAEHCINLWPIIVKPIVTM